MDRGLGEVLVETVVFSREDLVGWLVGIVFEGGGE